MKDWGCPRPPLIPKLTTREQQCSFVNCWELLMSLEHPSLTYCLFLAPWIGSQSSDAVSKSAEGLVDSGTFFEAVACRSCAVCTLATWKMGLLLASACYLYFGGNTGVVTCHQTQTRHTFRPHFWYSDNTESTAFCHQWMNYVAW